MKYVRLVLGQSAGLVVLSFLLGAVGGVANTGLIVLMHQALSDSPISFRVLFLSFCGLVLLLPVMRIVSAVTFARLTQRAIFNLRMHFAERILAAPVRRQELLGTSRLLVNMTSDVGAIAGALLRLPALCTHCIILVGCLSYLTWLSWTAALGTLGFIAVSVAGYTVAARLASGYLDRARDREAMVLHQIHALVEGIKELKLHRRRREQFFENLLYFTAKAFRRNDLIGSGIYTVADSAAQFLFFVLLGLLLFALPAVTEVSTDTLTGYTLTLLYIIAPLQFIETTVSVLARARVAYQKVGDAGLELAADSEIEQVTPLESRRSWDRLDFVGVQHIYHRDDDDRSFMVGPLNLALSSGQILFVTGGNGSGKTTLVKLLTGLYAPEAGEIRLDGEPVTDENRDSYRQLFSAVFWDYFLFETLLGLEMPELDARARDFLAKLRLEKKVDVEDGRLSTLALSTGQRKRLALLTAYLEDRPIYVFDEWAADQDPEFKEIFYRQLIPELKARGKTVFVISHDDRYYDVADVVIKLADGRAVEEVRGRGTASLRTGMEAGVP